MPPGGSSRYSPVKGGDALIKDHLTLPYRDYASSSEEEELYRKPYTDEVKS
jgi:hypothetical protein